MLRMHRPLHHLVVLLLTLVLFLPGVLNAPSVRAVPSPPILRVPGEGETTTADSFPPTGTPTFEWFPVAGADHYTIQVCAASECGSQYVTADTSATRFTPLNALPDGTIYWRVRAHDSTGWGDYSSSRSFVKSWLDFGNLTTQLLYPSADATVEFFEFPIFSWTPVTGAAFYRFQIFTQAGCPGSPAYSSDTVKPTHTPSARRGRGDYYWWVIPTDDKDHQGNPSECRHFFMDYTRIPTLSNPQPDSYETFTPEFRWTAQKGAYDYHLQYSTDPLFQTNVVNITTPNTRWMPTEQLANNKDYYWRVAARDTSFAEAPWSEVRHFFMAWYLTPMLLSPTQNYIHAPFPVYQWTPVAAAYKYRIRTDDNYPGYPSPKFNVLLADPRYDHMNWGTIYGGEYYYWDVRGEDAASNGAEWSIDGGFQYDGNPAPTLIYPNYYYDPALLPGTQPLGVRTDPTAPVPVFMWDRVVTVANVNADSYLVQVDDDPNFNSLNCYSFTENLSIAPTVDNPFTPVAGTTYYWRVQAYRGGSPMSDFSEVWPARFDLTLQEYTSTIAPYFPAAEMDYVWESPLLAWSPVVGAGRYRVQISTAADFSTLTEEAYALYGVYTPPQRLAPETYYWRVQAETSDGTPIGSWSATRRYFVSYPLRVGDPSYYGLVHPVMGDPNTRIGLDAVGDAYGGSPYDLTAVYFARDDNPPPENSFFYLTLDIPATHTTDMYFVFYVDVDHTTNSGGSSDPSTSPVFDVQADSLYLPERVFYVHHPPTGQISDADMYRWIGTYWQGPISLNSIGGGVLYDRGFYLELRIPTTEIDQGEAWGGATSVQVFTAPATGGQAYDTVPGEQVSGAPTGNLTNFVSVADKINPLHPWDNPMSNPVVYHTNPALSFAKPLYRSYIKGYRIQVDRDPSFTPPLIIEEEWTSGSPPIYFFLGTRWTWTSTFDQDNSIYWRVRVRHGSGYSAWSDPVRFTKSDYKPISMTVEYDYTTPTFRWDRVEGGVSTQIDVNRDPNFAGTGFSAGTPNPAYTRNGALADGTWYWRLRSYDANSHASDYTPVQSFVKQSLVCTLTAPIGGAVLNELPTLQWQDVLYPPTNPIVGSPKYHMILDSDPNFSTPYLWEIAGLDTTSVTPPSSLRLEDGTYYWKVAIRDGGGNDGPYSAVGVFYKEYLPPEPVSAFFAPSPDLTWKPVAGAAYYEVQICLDPNYSVNCQTFRTDQCNYVGTAEYAPGNYYWRVRMCDKPGACGPYTLGRVGPQGMIFLPLAYKH